MQELQNMAAEQVRQFNGQTKHASIVLLEEMIG
jgi:hypothetical protein